jgi:hypothetical protein
MQLSNGAGARENRARSNPDWPSDWTIMAKKRVLTSLCGCLLLLTIGVMLYFFGPRSEVVSVCLICGKEKATGTLLGLTWFDKERETDLSEWYQRKGLKAHKHRWVHLCSNHQRWGGQVGCYDSFGFELFPLELLRQVSEKVDQSSFEEFVKDYYAMRQDKVKTVSFVSKCRRIVPRTD